MDRETARQEIRSRIKCTDYLQPSKNGLYCCPKCGSGTGSNATGALKYYPATNTWTCFSCKSRQEPKYSGDVIDLHQMETGADYNTALSLLAQEIGVTIDPYRPTAAEDFAPAPRNDRAGGRRSDFSGQGNTETRPEAKSAGEAVKTPTEGTADFTAYYQECRERLTDPAAAAYLQRRGISLETAAAFYTIREHLYPEPTRAIEPAPVYSFAGPPEEPLPEVFYGSDTEFGKLITGRNPEDVWPIIDELVTAVQVMNPRLYASFIEKLA